MGTNSGSAKKLHEMAEEERRAFLEKKLGVNLENIKKSILNEKQADANIENLIGSAQLPMGIAGPVKVSGEHAKGEFYIPLATTEGALVASVSRGCSVISKSGGAEAVIIKNEQTRSILFKAKSVKEAKSLIPENYWY